MAHTRSLKIKRSQIELSLLPATDAVFAMQCPSRVFGTSSRFYAGFWPYLRKRVTAIPRWIEAWCAVKPAGPRISNVDQSMVDSSLIPFTLGRGYSLPAQSRWTIWSTSNPPGPSVSPSILSVDQLMVRCLLCPILPHQRFSAHYVLRSSLTLLDYAIPLALAAHHCRSLIKFIAPTPTLIP